MSLDELGRFVGWLRSPPEGVIAIDSAVAARTASTVSCHLAAILSCYDFHARFGMAVAADLVTWRRGRRGFYRPFLEGIGGRSRRGPRRPVRSRTERRLPETLNAERVARLLTTCDHLRDRLLTVVLAEYANLVARSSQPMTASAFVNPAVASASGAAWVLSPQEVMATRPTLVPATASSALIRGSAQAEVSVSQLALRFASAGMRRLNWVADVSGQARR